MNIEQIQNRLSKNYDDFTTKTLSSSIIEFQELFKEKYYTTDQVIEIVIENIPNGIVIYDDKNEKFDSVCAMTSGEFKISKTVLNDNEYFSYIFFHEFLHSISYKKHNNMQFMGFYTIEKGKDYEFKSKAFNEAFTEFMTLKRNKMCNYNPENKFLSGYDVGAHELEILTKIIPEQELIDCYFNKPNLLEKILKKYRMNMDEIFYSFYALEGMEYDIKALEEKRGLVKPQNLFKIIDGERYFYYNLLDSFGKVESEKEFNNKWSILLSELNSKYNFYNIDGIFRYGELFRDIDKIGIRESTIIENKASKENLIKYKLLYKIFNTENKENILYELYKIYSEDYNKYWDLLKDDFAILAYTFLDKIKNNYQLYDIEMYPRVYKYLENENTTIKNVDFEKISCEEEKIKFYIFNINDNTYIESNYDDTIVNRINKYEFEVKYGNQRGVLNIEKNIYEINNVRYNIKKIY